MESRSKYLGLDWLLNLQPWNGVNYTPLKFIRILLEKLGNPQNKYRTIHIAGTNGKGTVASLLNHIFVKTANLPKIGLMSSPHVFNINERCLINSCFVSDEVLDSALLKVQESCLAMETNPTFFVAITAAIFKIFEEQKVDLAIIEVGLGGRMDATNLIAAPDISVITSIGLDHQEQLGKTIAEIAYNKAGIINKNSELILGKLGSVAKKVILEEAKLKGVKPVYAKELAIDIPQLFHNKFIPEFFLDNLKIVLSCTELLKITPVNLSQILSDYYWPRRFNVWENSSIQGSCFIIDGAHNPPGVKMFLDTMLQFQKAHKKFKRISLMFGFLKRKEWGKSAEIIKQFVDEQKDFEINCTAICLYEDFVEYNKYSDFFDCVCLESESELRKYISSQSLKGSLVAIFGSLSLPSQIEEQLVLESFKRISFLDA